MWTRANTWRKTEWSPSSLLIPVTSAVLFPRASFVLSQLSSILFLQISLKMHSLQSYLSFCLILKHCKGETGTISQQSTKSWVHLRMCSDLVSTFCCSRVDINHSAERGSTCCTLPTSRPRCLASGSGLRSAHPCGAGIAYSSCVAPTIPIIQMLCHHHNSPRTSSHDCLLSVPRSTWHECEFGSLFFLWIAWRWCSPLLPMSLQPSYKKDYFCHFISILLWSFSF